MTELWQAHWDGPRPFVHPVHTPAGAVLTVDAPDDHPWHHALWSTVKFVNGENFWEEYDAFGLLRTRSVERTDGTSGPLFTAQIEWQRPERDGQAEIVIDEVRTIAHVALDDSSYGIDWTVELTPRVDVALDRTPFTTWGGYGGLTLRGSPEWTSTVLSLADDDRAHEQLRGERARWCHLQGEVPGAGEHGVEVGVAGVAILDHPANPRHPTPWYASTRADTYGSGWANLCNAAFLWEAPLEVSAGERFAMVHRVVVHDRSLRAAQLDELWSDWASRESPPS